MYCYKKVMTLCAQKLKKCIALVKSEAVAGCAKLKVMSKLSAIYLEKWKVEEDLPSGFLDRLTIKSS